MYVRGRRVRFVLCSVFFLNFFRCLFVRTVFCSGIARFFFSKRRAIFWEERHLIIVFVASLQRGLRSNSNKLMGKAEKGMIKWAMIKWVVWDFFKFAIRAKWAKKQRTFKNWGILFVLFVRVWPERDRGNAKAICHVCVIGEDACYDEQKELFFFFVIFFPFAEKRSEEIGSLRKRYFVCLCAVIWCFVDVWEKEKADELCYVVREKEYRVK